MLKLAVVGKDVSASQSPQMHAFILKKLGENCSYEKISVSQEAFSVRAEELFARFDAFNVTIPYKTEIIPYLKELRGDASLFGAVNTVTTRERAGYNTDGFGFLLMLENAGVEVRGKSVLVLGAGGAGRSCIGKLLRAGAEVYAYNRTAEKLQSIYREFGGFTPLGVVELCDFDIILNCTGVGMHDTVGKTLPVRFAHGVEPIGAQLLSRCSAAVDLIYVPEETEFLRLAKTLGKKTVNGASMLFYQAYMADCIYLNVTPNANEAKAFWEEYREKTK